MPLQQYLTNINKQFVTGNARELATAPTCKTYYTNFAQRRTITNEPARIACATRLHHHPQKHTPCYIEAKICIDLDSKNLKEQFDRYKTSLNNLFLPIISNSIFIKTVANHPKAIAEVQNGKIVPKPENFDEFKRLMIGFAQTLTQSIKSPVQLAEMMANKAKTLANTIALAHKR